MKLFLTKNMFRIFLKANFVPRTRTKRLCLVSSPVSPLNVCLSLCLSVRPSVFQVETLDGAVQTSTLQASRLKADLRFTQQETDTLRQQVVSLHKQLQNAHNKVSPYQGSWTPGLSPQRGPEGGGFQCETVK